MRRNAKSGFGWCQLPLCSQLLTSFELLACDVPFWGMNLASTFTVPRVLDVSDLPFHPTSQPLHPPITPEDSGFWVTFPSARVPTLSSASCTKSVLQTLNLFPWYPPCFLSVSGLYFPSTFTFSLVRLGSVVNDFDDLSLRIFCRSTYHLFFHLWINPTASSISVLTLWLITDSLTNVWS